MPRFKFEYGVELNEFMKGIGIDRIFDYEQADFSVMSDRLPYPYISQFQHKTFIEVDEEGTTAGAATMAVMCVGGSPTPTFKLAINRPFFFAIRDKRTGLILFMGSVVEPL
jgi:serpin B